MAFPNDLEKVDDKLFDRVWKIVQECGESERHFNNLQSVYRGIASTWLLGAFAAVGYLLFNKDLQGSHLEAAAFVCFAAATGIFLIWILDSYVYHSLLVAVFQEGYALETRYAWLPRQRTNMRNVGRGKGSAGRDPVRAMISLYYVGTILAPLLTGAVFWAKFLVGVESSWFWYLLFSGMLFLALSVIMYFFRKTTKD